MTPSILDGRRAQCGGAGRSWRPQLRLHADLFPDLMAAAIQRQNLALRAAKNGIVVARGDGE